ncbi:hypothetical protein QQF64_013426 [Cirrhinus molitorella]|uniref:Uncharacterized protein n=1 Tax=Cirrhinus molitorella TaxID=172907 RepID=A0ABR3LR64_9TELE
MFLHLKLVEQLEDKTPVGAHEVPPLWNTATVAPQQPYTTGNRLGDSVTAPSQREHSVETGSPKERGKNSGTLRSFPEDHHQINVIPSILTHKYDDETCQPDGTVTSWKLCLLRHAAHFHIAGEDKEALPTSPQAHLGPLTSGCACAHAGLFALGFNGSTSGNVERRESLSSSAVELETWCLRHSTERRCYTEVFPGFI